MEQNKLSWTLDVQEDPNTGECFIQFPEELLQAANWQEGDILEWKDLGDGSWSLTKKVSDAV